MAKTLLNAVNEVLKRVDVIDTAGELTTLTDSPRQLHIDKAVQAIGEGVDQLYSIAGEPRPNGMGEDTITLVTSTTAYALAADLVTLMFPFRDETNGQYIFEYPGGYFQMETDLAITTYTGLPYLAAIRPTDGKLVIEASPAAADNGKVYQYNYRKDLTLDEAADTVPFSDEVFRAMVPVWAEIWRRLSRRDVDTEMMDLSFARAARGFRQLPARGSWFPK